VLGFDDEMSTDHDWKPRVLLFLREDDLARHRDDVEEALRRGLPPSFRNRPVHHEIHTVRGYFLEQLAVDVDGRIRPGDWLTIPEHRLRMCTAGEVYHDEVGLQVARERLAYYPRDVWLYLLMAGWWRVHPEANLVGRAGAVGDELGSALVGSRLVSDLMRLCFLMERQYAPYSKWFGTAFSRLACGPDLTPTPWSVVRAEIWQSREEALLAAYEKLAVINNALQGHGSGFHRHRADVEPAVQGRLGGLPRSPARRDPGSGCPEDREAMAARSGRPVPRPAVAGRHLLLRLFDQAGDDGHEAAT